MSGVTDPDGDPVSLLVTAVAQDEPVAARTCPDAAPAPVDGSVQLRATRSHSGDGRVYHVFFSADDAQGGQGSGSVTVCVPRNRKDGSCVDGGPLVDSTGC